MKQKSTKFLIILAVFLTIDLVLKEFCYTEKINRNYYTILYSVYQTENSIELQEETTFTATFNGICVRGIGKDFRLEAEIALYTPDKSTNFSFTSDYMQNISSNRIWRTANYYMPLFFGWYPYHIKQMYYSKDFSIIVIPFFSQSKLLILSDGEEYPASLDELLNDKSFFYTFSFYT